MRSEWTPLKSGDVVEVIAPGYRSPPEHLQGAIEFLKNWGLVPRVPSPLYARDLLCSNSDEVRFRHLREALLAKDSRAIWCVRGGYGSNRLVPELARLRRPLFKPKLFIGLSDITTLHVFLNQTWHWPSIHGPLLDRLGSGAGIPKYVREMKKLVFGEIDEIEFVGLRPLNDLARGKGILRGQVSGGNLIVLQSTLGTKSEWRTQGKILFFEDIGERGYRVDRVLEQFKQTGLFNKAKAIVFGQFSEGLEANGASLVPAVLKRFAAGVNLPVFTGLPSGHEKIQRPVPFATRASLYLGERGRLLCSSGVEL